MSSYANNAFCGSALSNPCLLSALNTFRGTGYRVEKVAACLQSECGDSISSSVLPILNEHAYKRSVFSSCIVSRIPFLVSGTFLIHAHMQQSQTLVDFDEGSVYALTANAYDSCASETTSPSTHRSLRILPRRRRANACMAA